MSKKWNAEKIDLLLEAYEQNPCLWDVHSILYKNRHSRETAYLNMAKAMDIEGFSSADVKAKIRYIRKAYALQLRKIAKSKKSGMSSDEIYKPRVPWFAVADRILHQVFQIRESQSTEIGIGDCDSIENAQLTENDEHLSPSRDVPTALKTKLSTTAPKRFKKTKIPSIEQAWEKLKFILKLLNETPQEDNDIEYFGKTIVCQLKKLPELVALESIAYIQLYLVQQGIKASQSISVSPEFVSLNYETNSSNSES